MEASSASEIAAGRESVTAVPPGGTVALPNGPDGVAALA
jgi:hypothetical protein